MRKNLLTSIVVLSLLLVIAFSVAFKPASAEATPRKKTYCFIGAIPNPVGVNQEVLIHVGITDYLARADYGWEGLWVTIERPEGVVETIKDIRTDSTGGTGVVYVPRMPGVYRLQAHFPEQVNPVAVAGIPAGTIMEASSSWVLELKVLEEPVPRHPGFSPPQEYWTRPINAQLREWSTISGSWLRPGLFYFMAQYAPYNSAPEAPHILWTKPIAMGGLVGGEHEDISFEHGDAYEGKFSGSVIIAGRLYYNQFEARGGTAIQQDVVCVDLHTGEELWRRNWDNRRLSFGQLFYFDSYNYHGVFAYLWVVDGTTWYAYDAFSGRWVYTMTNVPSGTNLYGPKGEIYRYTIDLTRGWMTLWNTSRVVMYGLIGVSAGSWRPHGQTYDARRGIEWNKTIPRGLPGSVRIMWLKEMVVGAYLSWKECVFWALSLKPGEEGRLLFNRTWTPPPGNLTLSWTAASLEDGVFIIGAKETLDWYGFSLRDGRLLWGPTEPKHPYLDYYDKWYNTAVAYGKFFSGRYSGRLHCYDIKTGKLLWTYDLKDTYQEILWSNNWPLGIHFISDGKIYISYMEHSPIQPLRRGAPFVCLDVETGKELWSISIHGTYWGGYAIIGDSILVTFNSYDNRIYAIGKGPTATTVEAPNVGVPVGSTIVIRGTVMDISPGTRDVGVALRFPHGVPAVADECMADWMQYVYMQFPRPTGNMKGVWVKLDAVNVYTGEYIDIGGTHTDPWSGMFTVSWQPPKEGLWWIIASFPGSKSYYPSCAQTSIAVTAAPPPTPTPASPEQVASLQETIQSMQTVQTLLTAIVIVVLLLLAYVIYANRKMMKQISK